MALRQHRNGAAQASVELVTNFAAALHRYAAGIVCLAMRVGRRLLGRLTLSVRLACLCLLMVFACEFLAVHAEHWVVGWADTADARWYPPLAGSSLWAGVVALRPVAWVAAGVMLVAGLLCLWRSRWAVVALKISAASYLFVWLWLFVFIARVPSWLYASAEGLGFSKEWRNEMWVAGAFAWLPFALLGAVLVVCTALRPVGAWYGMPVGGRQWGDRLMESVVSGGRDPRFRSSTYWAAALHVLVLCGPLLVRGCGMYEGYEMPGGGQLVAQVVQVKRVKKEEKKYVLNMNSPFIFWVPKLEDSEIMQEVDQETLDTYRPMALTQETKSKIKGLWPGGMSDARVRFVRLEYRGGDWDQDMGQGADDNMLGKFAALTGLNVASGTESIPITGLRRFKGGKVPPFVFITGSQGMRLSGEEINTLRWYALEAGGMIFADNGGSRRNRGFDASFRNEMDRVFSRPQWIDIPNDDIIYRQPFYFPNGAPRLWHHSGDRALGIKHDGRWVVFYHQGDINDAWKTGHSGASAEDAEQAYRLAVNIINYAFHRHFAFRNDDD